MSAPEPRANAFLLGHDAAEAALVAALGHGRLHHAWLFTGPPGIGKATLAFRFARRLLAGANGGAGQGLEVAADDPVFHRVAAGTHADLLTVERTWDEKKKRLSGDILVDTARQIPEFLHLTPAEGGWRVVVIDGAEDLNTQSANAVLKVLEEPPAQAVLILTCSTPGRLLPTIRSRCRQLKLAPLGEPEVAALLERYLPEMPAGEREQLAAMAEGWGGVPPGPGPGAGRGRGARTRQAGGRGVRGDRPAGCRARPRDRRRGGTRRHDLFHFHGSAGERAGGGGA